MRKIILFDFDKTLVVSNSFPMWVKYLARRALLSLNIGVFARIIGLLLFRKIIPMISHAQFKSDLMRLVVPDTWNSDFATSIKCKINKEVLNALTEHHERGDKIIISSAAPSCYLVPFMQQVLGGSYHYISVVGACITDTGLNENFKELKVENLYKRGLISSGALLDVLYTDSWDDHYLAGITKKIILVRPDDKCLVRYMDFAASRGLDISNWK